MSEKAIIRDLTTGKIAPTLLRLAFPVMLSNLLQTVYNMVDMVIVGQIEGSAGLAAVSVGADLIHLFTFIGMGFATAGQIMVSQYLGAGKREDLNGVIGTLFSFNFLSAAFFSVLVLFAAPGMLHLLHVKPAFFQAALDYTRCCGAGFVFLFGYQMLSAILRGMGDSKHPMYFIAIASVLNIVLDLLFIRGFGMGAFGAALATVIAQGVSVLLCLGYLFLHRVQFSFDFRPASFRILKDPFLIMLKLGIPIAIQTSAGNISNLFVSSLINPLGVVYTAVTGVGNKLNSIALIVANALNTSGSSVIDQSYGAGKTKRVKVVFWHVFAFDLAFVSTLSILMLVFPEHIFSLFNKDPAALSLAPVYAPVAAISFMGFAFRSPSLSFINGLGQSRINFLMGIVEGYILRIGLVWFLGNVLGLGIYGYWYGAVIASYGYGLVVFPYFFSDRWITHFEPVV